MCVRPGIRLAQKVRVRELLDKRLRELGPRRQEDPRIVAGRQGLEILLTSIPQLTPPPLAYLAATPPETLERMRKKAKRARSIREARAESIGPSARRSRSVVVGGRALVYGPSQSETMSKIGRQNIRLAVRELFGLEHLESAIRRFHASVVGGHHLCGKCIRVYLKPLATNKSPACPECYTRSRLARQDPRLPRLTHAAQRRGCEGCALYSLPSINPSGKPVGRKRPPHVRLDTDGAFEV